ncbi:MAG: undecaprenyl/decaprenyl-phosphate alpha-N-acetylglucosaminyl 1-phosphate transferase [Bacteroidales bacterium]|nr:undecaprenyl/decaprenyl-phosphate alpha-N-acetylglucosaminyl 1-phosphate transferase [Bacteroidales bacterium]
MKSININFTEQIIIALLTTLLVSFILTFLLIKLSKKFNIYDIPDSRKLHKEKTPTLGGVAFSLACFVGIYLSGIDVDIHFIIATFILIIGGIIDDIYRLSWHKKLFFQCLATTTWLVTIDVNVIFEKIGLCFIPSIFQYIIVFISIIFFINAFNFIDGIDMLASVLAIINFLFLGMINIHYGNFHLFVTCVIISLSVAGFLYFNITPAKIFMGDTGSQIIGFWIVAVILETFLFQANSVYIKNKTSFLLLLSSVTFLPFIDAVRVTISRLVKKIPPYLPYKDHLHHLLLKNNFKISEIIAIISFLNFIVIFFLLLVYLNKPILTIMSIIFLKIHV